ncbi:response regulator, partial [Bacteriovoracales bacterium]|nr:response regulator [Bacteriovoracales bacterium]
IDKFIEESKIISTDSYQVKDWILEDKKREEYNYEEDVPFYQLDEENLENDIGRGHTIFIIDDLKDMRNLLKKALLPQGYKIIACHSAEHAQKKLKKEIPDLIIIDWMLPGMSGVEFIQELKTKDLKFSTIPVILLTAKSDEESKALGTKMGANGFLGKPFNNHELISMVNNHTHLKQKEKKLLKKNHLLEVSNMELDYIMDELYSQKKGQQQILDNIDEGIIVFDMEGVVQKEGSNTSEEIFQRQIFDSDLFHQEKNHYIWDILGYENEEKEFFLKWLNNVSKMNIPFQELKKLAPKSLTKVEGKYIELSYCPIYDPHEPKTIIKVMCIAKDKTTEKSLKKKVQKDEKDFSLIKNCLNRPIEFVELVLDSQHFIDKFPFLKNKEFDKLFREVHTLKARCGLFGLYELTTPLDDMESAISDKDKGLLELNFNTFVANLENFIKVNRPIIEAANKFLSEEDSVVPVTLLLKQINSSPDINELKDFLIKNYILTDLKKKFLKYKDFVQEIGEKQGKSVEFEIQGSEIMVDQSKYQKFVNTSIHLFRNMVDHGLEEEHIRIEKTKPKAGKIRGEFTLSNGHIQIVIEDDGQGLNFPKIKEKCLEQKLKNKNELDNLKEEELAQLIFEPGVSTKDNISTYSGRGVGLDAVREEVKNLGGDINVESQSDYGTRFIIKIPYQNVS